MILQKNPPVEETFSEYNLPTTIFRAGLLLGEAGSSFQILIKLVKRLPIMIYPHWTQTLTTPVDLNTVLTNITSAALDLSLIGKTFDLAGCKSLTAKEMGLKRIFLKVPFFTPTFSRLWVSLITNSPKDLVYPLIESLEHDMVSRPTHLFSELGSTRNNRDLLKNESLKTKSGRSFFRFRAQRKTVRSVQRLPLPKEKNAQWIKDQYVDWLPRFLAPLIVVKQDADTDNFYKLIKVCLFQKKIRAA